MSNNTQKVFKGFFSQTFVTIVLGVIEIISFSIMSRLLSQKDFGYYAAMVAVATIFQSLTETGIGSALIQKKELNKSYIDNAFTLSLILGIIISTMLCLSSGILARFVADETMTIPLRIFAITLFCQCLTSVNISLMQRKLQFIRIGIINLTSLVITTIIAIILALKGFGYYAILTQVVLKNILVLLISYFAVNIKYSIAFDKSKYKQIFGFGGWLTISAVFRNITNQIDRLLMAKLFSIEILGLYTRPKEFISSSSDKFNSIFDSVLFPILSTMQDEKERLQNYFIYTTYCLNILGIFICSLFLFNSELIIRIFFGQEWLKDVNTLFLIFAILPLLKANGRIGDIFLRAKAFTKKEFIFRIIELISGLLFVLIGYRFGLLIFATCVVLSYALFVVIKISYVASIVNVSISKTIAIILKALKPCIFILPLLFLCNILIPHTFFGNILQAIIYLLLVVILFLVFPSGVGKIYKETIYLKFRSFIKNKIVKLKNKKKRL